MSTHTDLGSMAAEAIDEYLSLVEICISTRKTDGGVYGYPSILLLFSVIDAMSNFAGHGKNTLHGARSLIPGLSDEQIKRLKNWYRNLPAHQAIVMPGTQLSDDPVGAPIEFNSNGEPTHIRVIPLYRSVKEWWDAFDKSRINPKFDRNQAPTEPVPTTISFLPGVSGCMVTTKR